MDIKKSNLLWGVIGVMFVFTLYLTFQVAAQGDIGAVAQQAAPAVKAASSGMVGGC